MIVDGGSWCNCKLALTIKPHPKPYKLQWINNDGGIVVKDQLSVLSPIGKYKEVICEVVPMEVGDILYGHPWQFDKQTLHDNHNIRLVSSTKERK